MHPDTAAYRTDTARILAGRLPVTLKALEAGHLTHRHAETVARATEGLDVADAQAVEAAAVAGNVRRLNHRLNREIARIDPELIRKKATKARANREVVNWTDPAEGVAGFHLQGPPERVAQIKEAIDIEARPRVSGECRTIATRRFDTLLSWAQQRLGLDDPPSDGSAGRNAAAIPPTSNDGSRQCGSCDRSGPARIPISVTVSAETLLHLSETPGELDGFGPIPAEIARELAADGSWRRWLLEPTGRLADVGATTYRPSAAPGRYVRGRDRTCRFPTCTRPAGGCDLDHTRAFHSQGGETSAENLVALCRRHHRLKHETDWIYFSEPNGHVVWTAPSGRRYTAYAEHHGDDEYLSAEYAEWHRKKHERDQQEKGYSTAKDSSFTPRLPDEPAPF
jgi:hypothetical protein